MKMVLNSFSFNTSDKIVLELKDNIIFSNVSFLTIKLYFVKIPICNPPVFN